MKESDKGDIGVSQVTADLTTKGFDILLPFSASLPYDMVIHKNSKFYKVQVKYRENHKGYVDLELRRANSRGKQKRHKGIKADEVDLYAIFCPDTAKVYYIDPKICENHQTMRIRLDVPTKFRATKAVRYAKDCLSLDFLGSD
jgi:hypothetical protein